MDSSVGRDLACNALVAAVCLIFVSFKVFHQFETNQQNNKSQLCIYCLVVGRSLEVFALYWDILSVDTNITKPHKTTLCQG